MTLTAAATLILVDRPWTPGDTFQAEDRIWRIGQKSDVRCIWMQAFPWDVKVDEMIMSKDKTSSTITGQEGAGANSSSVAGAAGAAGAAKLKVHELIKLAVTQASTLATFGF